MKAPEAAISNEGQSQQIKISPPLQRSYIAISPPFLANYPVTVSSIRPLQQVQAVTQRSRTCKPARPPCHHARYVLGDKPKRTVAANSNIVCTNCGTRNTSAWRRSAEGKSECNACNLFFRKNGRKRPQSMRRDTIARRYRLSRCDLCEMEAQNTAQAGTVQPQKKRGRRSAKNKTSQQEGAAGSNQNSQQLAAITSTQTSLAQQYFIAHPGIQQPLQTFLAPSLNYVHQNPMVMSYATERTVFNVVSADQQMGSAAPLDAQFCFVRNANSASSLPPGYQVVAKERTGPIPQTERIESSLIKKSMAEIDALAVAQREMPEQFQRHEQQENYGILKGDVEKSGFDALSLAKKECMEADYTNALESTGSTPVFVSTSINSESKQALDSQLQQVEEKSHQKVDAELVFRSL